MRMMKNKILASLFISISLSVTYYYMVCPWSQGIPGNTTNFWVFTSMSKMWHLKDLYPTWRPRIGGLSIAGWLVDKAATKEGLRSDRYEAVFGIYHAVWLFAIFCTLIVYLKDKAPFIILGCFASLFYAMTPLAVHYHYPWDMPAMFFFTLCYLMWTKKQYNWIIPTILVGTFFKDTIFVAAILFLFTDMKYKVRYFIFGTVSAIAFRFGLAHTVDHILHAVTPQSSSITTITDLHKAGINSLFSLKWNNPIFMNGGIFLVAMLLPVNNKENRGCKALIASFFCLSFAAGSSVFIEVRVMMEVIPVSVIYLYNYLYE